MSHQLRNWMCEAGVAGSHADDAAMDWAVEEIARLRGIVEKLPEASLIRYELEATKGATGSGTVACRLWHCLQGVVRQLEAAEDAREDVK